MQKCQEKIKRIEKLQEKYAKQLSDYENNSLSLINHLKPQKQQDNQPNQIHSILHYSNGCLNTESKTKMLNDLEESMRNINDYSISKNYINLCSFLLKGPPSAQYSSKKSPIQEAIQLNQSNQAQPELKNERVQVKAFDHSNSSFIKPKVVISMNQNKASSINWKEAQKEKSIIMKQQNVFLSNELINLKVKIGKLNNKNIMLANMIKSQEQVKNFKVLDKFIESFIENLALNWNDIVDLIISNLLEEEVLELNSLELQRIDYENLRLTTFAEVMKHCSSNSNNNTGAFNVMFDSMNEVTDMISKAKLTEEAISKKYNINK